MSKYDTEIDLNNSNTSHNQILALVGQNKLVLDVGCSSGYLAKVLVDRGCTVSGVEFDAGAAEEARPLLDRLVIGDLEQLDLVHEFGEAQFDVVVFGDVLEHLRDPLPVLRQARPLLRADGFVVVSLPNIAHGAVRLSLLSGHFDYRSVGLLDDTHLRFFTRESCLGLLSAAGFVGVDVSRTTAGLFETEFPVKPEDFDQRVIDTILDDIDATTYQFVVKAIPDGADAAVRGLVEEIEEQRLLTHERDRHIEALGRRIRALEAEVVAVCQERDELGRIAHDEREKHLDIERTLREIPPRNRAERLASLLTRRRSRGTELGMSAK